MDFQRKTGISFWEIMKEIAGGMCNMPCCFKQLQEGGATRDATKTLCITATHDDVTYVTETLNPKYSHAAQWGKTCYAALHPQAMHRCTNGHNKHGRAPGEKVSTVAVMQIDSPVDLLSIKQCLVCGAQPGIEAGGTCQICGCRR